jgi:hypothetical protein
LAVADIGLILKKRKGGDNQRILHAHSRYQSPKELIISLEDGEYSVLGSANQVRYQEQRSIVMACLSTEFKSAEEIATKVAMADGTCRTVLNALFGDDLISRQGSGTRGKAFLYALKSENDSAQNQSLGACAIIQSPKMPGHVVLPSVLAQIQTVFPEAKVSQE